MEFKPVEAGGKPQVHRYETCRRLWKQFFYPQFDEAHGTALVDELLMKRQFFKTQKKKGG